MYNIKLSELKKFASQNTIKAAEFMVSKNFFPLDKIEIKDNPNRYDTKIYYVTWKHNERWMITNKAQIEVDIEDNIISFVSNCICLTKYNQMCEHTVSLALSIIKLHELMRQNPEQYERYEESLLKQYETKRAAHLERIRLKEIQQNKKIINRLLSNYDFINKKVMVNEKIGFEVFFRYDNGYYLSLRVGATKKYVVKSIKDLINAIKNKEVIRYGKDLEFNHDINNFDLPARIVIEMLLKTTYWIDETYKTEVGNRYRSIAISGLLFEDFLSQYHHNYINYVQNDFPQKLYITNKPFEGKLFLDEEKIILKDVKNYQLFIGETKNFINFDGIIHPLTGVSEVLKPIYRQIAFSKKIVIKDSLKTFLKEIYPIIYDEIEIDDDFKLKNPVKHIKIDSYFDYDDNVLTVSSRYFLGEIEVNYDMIKASSYSFSRLLQYQQYLEGLGFIKGRIDELEGVTQFLKADLGILKKCGDVYLSDCLKRIKIKSLKKIVFNLSYDVDIFSVCFADLGFSDDELHTILNEFKKKKKFIKLKNDVIFEVDEKNIQELADLVDDFNLDDHFLSKKQVKPLYVAAKAINRQNDENLIINYNEKLISIITKLKSYKESNYLIPKHLTKILRSYQIDGFKWLKTLTDLGFGGILADDMGLGKTLEVITLFLSDNKEMPSLIISPTSLIFNWKNELEKWASELKYTIISGSINERKKNIEAISNEKIIYITSYDTFKNDVELYADKKFRFVILDEAQFIKNYYTQKAKAVKQINSEVRFVLTGTPIENSLLDLWSIFDFLLPDYLSNQHHFKSKFERAITSDDNQELLNILIKKITPFVLRRTKKNVLNDLPSKFETIQYAQMGEDQRKLYEAYLLKTKQDLTEGKSKIELLSALTRLRQICVHPAMFLDNYLGGSAKIELAIELINHSIQNDHKILLFSQFTSVFEAVEEELIKRKIKYFVLTGATKALQRISLVDEFNENNEIKVFLISVKAGGTGLNLVGADIVIHLDPWWNVSVENQATDRAHRIGQKRSVQVIKLVCDDSIEQKVIELQNLKKELADKIICDDDGNIQKLDEKDLDYLLS